MEALEPGGGAAERRPQKLCVVLLLVGEAEGVIREFEMGYFHSTGG